MDKITELIPIFLELVRLSCFQNFMLISHVLLSTKASNTQLGIAVMASFAQPNMQTASPLPTKKDANVNGVESHHSGGQTTSSIKRIEEETPVESSAGTSIIKSRYVSLFSSTT